MNAHALKQSFAIHLFFFLLIAFVLFNKTTLSIQTSDEIEFEVIKEPEIIKEEMVPVINAPKKIEAPPTKPVEAVYGLNRNSLTSDSEVSTSVKVGNTIAKSIDDKKLKDDDPDSLPIPSAEYLVTSMPVVLNEVRPDYPKLARDKGIEGKVVMDILIDQNGVVREAVIVSDPGNGMGEAALRAIKKFKFRPALIDKKKVAVKIKYAINFVLEE
jgi:protein TonB